MTDRDSHRLRDPLHTEVSGESDSGDSWGEGSTPVGRPSRRKVEVDPSAFEPDVRWREFDEMRREVRLCAEERMAGRRRKKWITGAVTGALGSVGVALAFAIRALSDHGAAGEVERQQRELVRTHELQIRAIQTQQAASAALLDVLLRRMALNP